ncbi:MAG: hypothetical protein LLG43_01540 [Deltaproteobacteria bacterium]|nr:hypothetical protein [Deltaproteobacteria bacterium]
MVWLVPTPIIKYMLSIVKCNYLEEEEEEEELTIPLLLVLLEEEEGRADLEYLLRLKS